MDLYENHLTLQNTIIKNRPTHIQKLKICKKIVEALKSLHNNGIIHSDINLNNIIIDEKFKDPLLIDIDGSIPKEVMTDSQYEKEIITEQYQMTILVLSYIYNFNFERYIYKNGLNKFKTNLHNFNINDEIKKYVINLINNDNETKFEYIDAYIDNLKDIKIM